MSEEFKDKHCPDARKARARPADMRACRDEENMELEQKLAPSESVHQSGLQKETRH